MNIGVSSLSFGMVTGLRPPTPLEVLKAVDELRIGVQVVPLKGWRATNMVDLAPKVLALEGLFFGEKAFSRWVDSPGIASTYLKNLWHTLPHTPMIGYGLQPRFYVHAVSEMCGGWWSNLLDHYDQGYIQGIVMDTCHTLTPRQGYFPVSNSPEDFARQVAHLVENDYRMIFHLQPSRIPRGGTALVTSNFLELYGLIRGARGNRLSTMLSPLKGVHDVPIIIEIDPKIGFFIKMAGMKWILRLTKKAILREIG